MARTKKTLRKHQEMYSDAVDTTNNNEANTRMVYRKMEHAIGMMTDMIESFKLSATHQKMLNEERILLHQQTIKTIKEQQNSFNIELHNHITSLHASLKSITHYLKELKNDVHSNKFAGSTNTLRELLPTGSKRKVDNEDEGECIEVRAPFKKCKDIKLMFDNKKIFYDGSEIVIVKEHFLEKMAKSLMLRCQFGDGRREILKGLTTQSTVLDLKQAVATLTNIPVDYLKILNGFPPKEIDISDTGKLLNELPIRSGDTLVIAENKRHTQPNVLTNNQQILSQDSQNGVARICRKVVPADNSCLFASVSFTLLGDVEYANDIRQLTASCIQSDPSTYNDVLLGMSNNDYVKWLLKKDSWGGAIELNVLSKNYSVEIAVADIQSGRIDRFGEDAGYKNRIFLLYDGIHYDPLGLGTDDVIVQTVFPCGEVETESDVLRLARECKKNFEFTDLTNFSLRCLICNKPLTGQSEAQSHAKSTGHMNFGEIKAKV